MPTLRPTNEEFRDSSYNNDPRLRQPSSGARQVRNVQTDKNYDPDKRRGGTEERSASTWDASMQASEDNKKLEEEAQQRAEDERIRSVRTAQNQNARQGIHRASTSSVSTSKKLRGKKRKGAKSAGGNLIGRSVTLSIWSWGFFIWLWFQLPFTILSIVFMAMTQVLYEIFSTTSAAADEDGIVETVINSFTHAVEVLAGVANEFLKLFGFHLDALNPANMFILTHTLLVLVGWLILLTIGIIYTMTGQKAFSGKGAGGKNVMFILAFVGYAVPILNILPLFFFWTLMVLKNPR